MEGQHHPPPHHLLIPQHQRQQHFSVNVDVGDRFPQWSIEETKEFLMIRAELDQTFMETKRNKLLWGTVSAKMKERGYNRSAEQCKCKWKNLVTRYKGCGTMEPAEAMRQQFPFYSDLQAIYDSRNQRAMWDEGEGGVTGLKKKAVQLSSDDEEEEDNEESEVNKGIVRKKKKGKISGNIGNNLREILKDFMRKQTEMEMQWRKAFEVRENERRVKEIEWRQTMEELEKERIMMDRRWREREEQRRMREEARAEKRDALITALLNKLGREDHNM